MSTAQFTLNGRQNRELIALCMAESGVLTPYLERGRVLFKGSATVSCLTRRLTGTPLRICGRITANGMKGPLRPSQGAHFLLYQGGGVSNVDGSAGEVLKTFGPGDLFVTGANALLQGTAMLTLSQETRDMAGGLTLRDGNVEVNCAFETQLRVLREEMAAEVAGILFS